VLLADAYGGYNGVVAGNALTRAGCWSHARRKFVDAEKAAPEIAREAVTRIGTLFALELQAKDVSVAECPQLPQEQSAPLLAGLHRKLLIWKEQLLPKHPMADVVNYTLSQWEALTVFTTAGAVPINNNVSERGDEADRTQSQELFIRWQPSWWANRSDPGQLDQQLPPA
jgi:transposase